LSNNSFGRIHVFAEIFDIVLRSNHSVCTVWSNNNVFTGMQNRLRLWEKGGLSPDEQCYARTTLNAARSKLQAAVHFYVNEQIKPKSKQVKVIPDAGAFPRCPSLLVSISAIVTVPLYFRRCSDQLAYQRQRPVVAFLSHQGWHVDS
jgi:hypothetical protein